VKEQDLRATLQRPKKWRRVMLYLFLSACATGFVEGLTGCVTYSSGHGKFFECFFLYAIPLPMAVGMFKLPTQLVGGIICSIFTPERARLWAWTLGCIFFVGLLLHIVLRFRGYQTGWDWFAFVTVDFGILAAIAFAMRRPRET
jgi:FtsH-binding integral membrane protein